MKPARCSVRPPIKLPEVSGGLGALGDKPGHDGDGDCRADMSCIPCDGKMAFGARPMFPVVGVNADIDGNADNQLELEAREEEQAEMPLCLPSVYQPTRSEYLDHCVTHYPFRAWC